MTNITIFQFLLTYFLKLAVAEQKQHFFKKDMPSKINVLILLRPKSLHINGVKKVSVTLYLLQKTSKII